MRRNKYSRSSIVELLWDRRWRSVCDCPGCQIMPLDANIVFSFARTPARGGPVAAARCSTVCHLCSATRDPVLWPAHGEQTTWAPRVGHVRKQLIVRCRVYMLHCQAAGRCVPAQQPLPYYLSVGNLSLFMSTRLSDTNWSSGIRSDREIARRYQHRARLLVYLVGESSRSNRGPCNAMCTLQMSCARGESDPKYNVALHARIGCSRGETHLDITSFFTSCAA